MELKELTERMHAFVTAKGWYDSGSQHPQTLRNLAISLTLEASEILEIFQWTDDLPEAGALEEELADVLLYLIQMASLANIDLEKAVLRKLDRNYDRSW